MYQYLEKPYEQLTPKNCALILIDHQQGLMLTTQSVWLEQLKRNTLGLANIAKVFGIPALITSGNQHTWQGPLYPELSEILSGAPVIERTALNCMQDSRVVDWLKQVGRQKVVFAGVSTDVCVALSSIAAADAGYEAHCVLDACSTWDRVAEQGAMMRMTQRGVIITNWKAVGGELQGDWGKHADTAKGFTRELENFNAANAAAAATIVSSGGKLV